MANYELGCLLGGYDGGQSFEQISSWDTTSLSLPNSFTSVATRTHSSYASALFVVPNNNTNMLSYDFTDSYNARKSTAVDTHSVKLRGYTQPNFASMDFIIGSGSNTISEYNLAYNVNSTPYMDFSYTLTDSLQAKLFINYDTGVSFSGVAYMDDFTTTIDPISVNPSFELSDNEALLSAEHTTLNKSVVRYKQGNVKQWSVPVDYLPSSEAALINDWWSKQYKLLWTVDSTSYVVQLVNDETPVTKLKRPYTDIFRTVLKLQAVHTSLDF